MNEVFTAFVSCKGWCAQITINVKEPCDFSHIKSSQAFFFFFGAELFSRSRQLKEA